MTFLTCLCVYRLYFSHDNIIYQSDLIGSDFDPLEEEEDIILPEHLLVYKVL